MTRGMETGADQMKDTLMGAGNFRIQLDPET
jgi:hypothetical protein